MADQKASFNLLIGVTGSVAAIKLKDLVKSIKKRFTGINIKIIPTKNSLHFIDATEIGAEILTDEMEWSTWDKIGDDVLHIELCKWVDVMVIAPLDANTLAKVANGLCDNLLTCVVRAWRCPKPLLFAPSMNTFMFDHPLTSQHINTLTSFGYKCIPPVSKKLACGDVGNGAMASVEKIIDEISYVL